MCLTSRKRPKLQATPVEQPKQEEAKPLVSPEEIQENSTGDLRTRTSRRSLRIDLGTGGEGTGLNAPQG